MKWEIDFLSQLLTPFNVLYFTLPHQILIGHLVSHYRVYSSLSILLFVPTAVGDEYLEDKDLLGSYKVKKMFIVVKPYVQSGAKAGRGCRPALPLLRLSFACCLPANM